MSVAALADIIVSLAGRAGESEDAVSFCFGEVKSAEPLEVMLEQRLLLPEDMLILTDAVIGEAVWLNRPEGEDAEEEEKIYRVSHKLTKGDRVLLARATGGQAYVILSRYYATEKDEDV